jgi:hypothetical protein
MRFGGSLTGVALVSAFMAEFDNIVIGRVLGPTQLGFYSVATRLPMLLILNLAVVAGRVLFPAFASLRQGDEMQRAVITSIRYTAIVTLPLAVFTVIFAEPLVLALFGDRWRPAIGAMQVLALWALMTTMAMIWGNMFKACARPDIILKTEIPQVVALVVGSLVLVNRGIVAVSWVQAGIAIGAQITLVVIGKRMFGMAVHSVLGALRGRAPSRSHRIRWAGGHLASSALFPRHAMGRYQRRWSRRDRRLFGTCRYPRARRYEARPHDWPRAWLSPAPPKPCRHRRAPRLASPARPRVGEPVTHRFYSVARPSNTWADH